MDKRIAKVFLKNGFYFEGRFISQDERFLQMTDRKTGGLKIINLDEISNMEIIDEVEK